MRHRWSPRYERLELGKLSSKKKVSLAGLGSVLGRMATQELLLLLCKKAQRRLVLQQLAHVELKCKVSIQLTSLKTSHCYNHIAMKKAENKMVRKITESCGDEKFRLASLRDARFIHCVPGLSG